MKAFFWATVLGFLSTFVVPLAPAFAARESVTVRHLSNGLAVVFAERHSSPNVAIRLALASGSGAEGELTGLGLAHFSEHLLADAYADWAEREGLLANAKTGVDAVEYFLMTPSSRFLESLAVFAHSVTRRTFSDELFENEKSAVLKELAGRLSDATLSAYERLEREAFRVHAYGFPGGGDLDATQSITRAEFEAYIARRFVAPNLVLVIAGDVRPDEVLPAVEQAFGAIPRAPYAPPYVVEEPPMRYPRDVVDITGSPHAIIARGWHIPDRYHSDAEALETLAFVLGGDDASRFERLLVRPGRVISAEAYATTARGPGIFALVTKCAPKDRDAVLAAMMSEVAAIAKNGPTRREIARAHRSITRAYAEQTETVLGLSSVYATHYLAFGTIAGAEDVSRYLAVGPSDVARVARQYLVRAAPTTVTFLPKDAMPEAIAAPTDHVVPPVRAVESDGAVFLGFPDPGRDVGTISIMLRFDSSRLAPGALRMVARMIERGGSRLDADTFAERFAATEGAFLASVHHGYLRITLLDVHAGKLDRALALARHALESPRLRSAADLEAIRAELLLQIEEDENDGWEASLRHARAFAFPGHTYGSSTTQKDARALRGDDLVAAHASLTRSGMIVTVSGGLPMDRIRAWSRTLLLGRTAPVGGAALLPAPRAESVRFALLNPTAYVLVSAPIPPAFDPRDRSRYHPDAMPLAVASKVLDQRIQDRTRRATGISYDQGVTTIQFLDANLVIAYVEVAERENIATAKAILLEEFARLVREGVAGEEFFIAKRSLAASYDLHSETPAERAAFAAWKEFASGEGLAARDAYMAALSAVTPETLRHAVAQVFTPDRLSSVIQDMKDPE